MKKVWSLLLLTALIFTVSTSAYAQMQDPVKWSFEVKQKAGNKAEFIATADIENKWHL